MYVCIYTVSNYPYGEKELRDGLDNTRVGQLGLSAPVSAVCTHGFANKTALVPFLLLRADARHH